MSQEAAAAAAACSTQAYALTHAAILIGQRCAVVVVVRLE